MGKELPFQLWLHIITCGGGDISKCTAYIKGDKRTKERCEVYSWNFIKR